MIVKNFGGIELMRHAFNRLHRVQKVLLFILLVITGTLKAQFFTRNTTAGAIVTDSLRSVGISWVDINNDGYQDAYIAGEGNQFYRNLGNGSFERVVTGPHVTTTAVSNIGVWADYDNDGFSDLFVSNYAIVNAQGNPVTLLPNYLYKNNGEPDFSMSLIDNVGDSAISISASWVDIDLDGNLDMLMLRTNNFRDRFFRNEGNGQFIENEDLVFLKNRSFGASESWIDIDNDSDVDLYIVNRGGTNELYKSLAMETGDLFRFQAIENTPLTAEGLVFDIGASWADYDNDGDFDMFLAISGAFGSGAPDRLFRNDGDWQFTQITDQPPVTTGYNSAFGSWADYDNDGDLDLFVGEVNTGQSPGHLYRNEGDGNFLAMLAGDVGEIVGEYPGPQGGNWVDYDNDGDMDLFVLHIGQPTSQTGVPQPNFLIQNNQGNQQNWLAVNCQGTFSNRSAIGAVLRAKAMINGSAVWQTRVISGLGQSGLNSQPPLSAHFGLGNATIVDTLVIHWPSGFRQLFTNVPINSRFDATEVLPQGFIRANFITDTTTAINSDSLTVQFTDLSVTTPGLPVTNYEWDFDNDGIVDAVDANPRFTFSAADTYSVRLRASNAFYSTEIIRKDLIKITGLVPLIEINTQTLNLGFIDVNTAVVDTMFYIYNRGGLGDSVTVAIDLQNVGVDSALAVSPTTAWINPGDSLAVTFSLFPNMLAPNGPFYTPLIKIESAKNYGDRSWERTVRFRIIGALSIDPVSPLVEKYDLEQNYPNPFNPSTNITFQIADQQNITLQIFDLNGRLVRTLVNESRMPGKYTLIWDGRTNDGHFSGSGIYFYKLSAGKHSFTRKMLLLR